VPKGRIVYKRLSVKDSDLEDTINELFAGGWNLAEKPTETEPSVEEFYRAEHPEADLLETINKLAKDGWSGIGWESEDPAYKPYVVTAVRYGEPEHTLVATKFLKAKDELRVLRAMVSGLEEELEAMRIEKENEGETGEEEPVEAPAPEGEAA
jgi:hypothetical protein